MCQCCQLAATSKLDETTNSSEKTQTKSSNENKRCATRHTNLHSEVAVTNQFATKHNTNFQAVEIEQRSEQIFDIGVVFSLVLFLFVCLSLANNFIKQANSNKRQFQTASCAINQSTTSSLLLREDICQLQLQFVFLFQVQAFETQPACCSNSHCLCDIKSNQSLEKVLQQNTCQQLVKRKLYNYNKTNQQTTALSASFTMSAFRKLRFGFSLLGLYC